MVLLPSSSQVQLSLNQNVLFTSQFLPSTFPFRQIACIFPQCHMPFSCDSHLLWNYNRGRSFLERFPHFSGSLSGYILLGLRIQLWTKTDYFTSISILLEHCMQFSALNSSQIVFNSLHLTNSRMMSLDSEIAYEMLGTTGRQGDSDCECHKGSCPTQWILCVR